MYNYNPYNFYGNPGQQPQRYSSPMASQQPQAQDERIWVQNETAAEAYLMAPNSFVRLWNASEPVFYEKRSDANGRPYPLEAFTYARREPQEQKNSDYPNNSIDKQLKAIEERVSALEKKGEAANVRESNGNDETV